MKKTFAELGFGREFAWIDLANSYELDGFGRPTDHLKDSSWLAAFLQHWKFAHVRPHRVPYAELIELRTLLRRIAEKLAEGNSLNSHDVAALNLVLNIPASQQLFQHQNGLRTELVPLRPGWDWIFSRIVASFAEMMDLDRTDRMKICPNGGCRWIFYDGTKGNTRLWCNDRTCGNRERVRRARAGQRKKK